MQIRQFAKVGRRPAFVKYGAGLAAVNKPVQILAGAPCDRAVACRKGRQRLAIESKRFALVRLPVLSAVVGSEDREPPLHRIAQQDSLAVKGIEPETIEEPIRSVGVLEQQCPCAASVDRLEEPALFASSGSHHNRRRRIPCLDAAKIECG